MHPRGRRTNKTKKIQNVYKSHSSAHDPQHHGTHVHYVQFRSVLIVLNLPFSSVHELLFNPRELGEVKGIVLGKVLYYNKAPMVVTAGSAAYAVKARSQTIQQEYERKAAAADIKFNGTLPGAQGPIAAKLASFGQVQALAFGWFGECSPALEHHTISRAYHTIPYLLSRAAEFGSHGMVWYGMAW